MVRALDSGTEQARALVGTSRCVLRQDTLLSRCLSPDYLTMGGNPAMD